MDYKKIRLNNERSTHVVKRLNRLSTVKFLGVLYRENMFRLLGFSFLMLICLVPMLIVQFYAASNLSAFRQTLPVNSFLGFSSGVWQDVETYYSNFASQNSFVYGLYTVVAALAVCLIFSAGFAVIRDAFWTGKLATVGVFRSMGRGIAANIGYAFVSTFLIAVGVFGVFQFYSWAASVMYTWIAVVLTVILSLVMLTVACYLLILCSVAVTYKQKFVENLDDSWRLLWLNFLPNLVHLMIALLPIPLYILFSGSILQTLFLAVILVIGGLYFPLVWQTHMMKTFALFHPVEPKKKKDVRREEAEKAAELKRAK